MNISIDPIFLIVDLFAGFGGTITGFVHAEIDGHNRVMNLVCPIQTGIKFLSIEPLHGPVDLMFNKYVDMGHKMGDLIDWVIVGGESGNENGKYRYRPCDLVWIESIVDQCTIFNIPVFVKQLGTYLSKELHLKDRHGGNIDEWPAHLQIREFPNYKLSTTN